MFFTFRSLFSLSHFFRREVEINEKDNYRTKNNRLWIIIRHTPHNLLDLCNYYYKLIYNIRKISMVDLNIFPKNNKRTLLVEKNSIRINLVIQLFIITLETWCKIYVNFVLVLSNIWQKKVSSKLTSILHEIS